MGSHSGRSQKRSLRMKNVFKILLTLICLYVFLAKIYAIGFSLVKRISDWPVLLVDVVVLCACVLLVLFLWRNRANLRYGIIWCILIVGAIFAQLYVGLFNFLIKDPGIDQTRVLWAFDLPNLLSLLILVVLMIMIIKKKACWKNLI